MRLTPDELRSAQAEMEKHLAYAKREATMIQTRDPHAINAINSLVNTANQGLAVLKEYHSFIMIVEDAVRRLKNGNISTLQCRLCGAPMKLQSSRLGSWKYACPGHEYRGPRQQFDCGKLRHDQHYTDSMMEFTSPEDAEEWAIKISILDALKILGASEPVEDTKVLHETGNTV